MPTRVSPAEPNPTHHLSLRTRDGEEIGLILCDDKGDVTSVPSFSASPVETTALKQTSGNSGYDSFDYPYSPIVQDDLSGGRGGIDFERDSTRYMDGYRVKAGRANKAYAGPQEQYTVGLQSMDQSLPGNVAWHQLTETGRVLYKRFAASASYTAKRIWLLARTHGTPGDLTIAIYSDSAGAPNAEIESITVAATRMDDILSEWLCETISQALVLATHYWIVITGDQDDDTNNHWKIAVSTSDDSTYTSADFTTTPDFAAFDLYYRLTSMNTEQTCIPFEYKEAQYFVVNNTSGAPKLFMAGDRGAADANTGNLTKLIDGTKNWVPNEHAGKVVAITDGPGSLEKQLWRIVVSNTATELVVSEAWTIEHTTATEYVLYSDSVSEITGHGLTAPVTDVLVSTTGVIYFCMGDTVTVRRMRSYTNAGVWTREYADETASTKATFMVYKEQAAKIVIACNRDATGDTSTSTMSNASVPDWGTALTWSAAVKVGSKYRRINGLIVHPEANGSEAVWVMKTDIPYILPGTGNPYPVNLEEMRSVRGSENGVRPMRNGVYLYFPLQQGLERYYGSQFDDIGPNLGDGLPTNRRGPIVWMQTYPGKFFVAIDAGASGYSSVLASDGWHEHYRAPLGQRIRAVAFQPIPGPTVNKLWVFAGNDLVYLPFPSDTVNELEDSAYAYTHEFAVTLSRMHAGMFDVMKLVKRIKIQSEQLQQGTCWFELDYRLNEDEVWTAFTDSFTQSPTQAIDLTNQYGLAGKRLQLRVRGYTADSSQSPIFLAIIIDAVLRTDVKYMYPVQFRVMDREPLLALNEEETMSALEKLNKIRNLADASTDSMIRVSAVSILYDGLVVFLNPPQIRQARVKTDPDNPYQRDIFVCSATMQEA